MNIDLQIKIAQIEKSVRASKLVMPNLGDFHRTYWENVVPLVGKEGLWMEFGVFRGRSIQKISSLTKECVFGFDSFEGLHEYWDSDNPKGVYSSGGQIPKGAIRGDENHSMFDPSSTKNTEPWNPNIFLIKGYFEETLPIFLKLFPQHVAFMNIDSDLYSSCSTILSLLKDRIQDGTIICFDELLDYPDYRNGEIKAFAEFLLETGYDFEPLIYQSPQSEYTQACVKIIK